MIPAPANGVARSMMPLSLEKRVDCAPALALSPNAVGMLNHLRFIAMNCRVKPHTELFEACALLHVTRNASQEAHAEALMRCLNEAIGQPARLLAPGVVEMTFDEHWLVQLGQASARQDLASLNFLIRSRVSREHQRLFTFLVSRISDSFSPL